MTYTVTKPNGATSTGNATTGSSGKAVWSYRISPKDPKGTYTVVSRATVSSTVLTSSPVTFQVN